MNAFTYDFGEANDPRSFSLRFEACVREPRSWKEELITAAHVIAERARRPIIVCASGGYDSEIACRSFLEARVPFSVLTLQHEEGTNAHDVGFARRWCEKEGVEHEAVRFSVLRFLNEEAEGYSAKYPAVHPFRYLQLRLLELAEERGAFAVLASGEQIYLANTANARIERGDVYMQLSSGTAMPLEWCRERGVVHEPYFHYATPELCLAWLRIPLVSYALSHPDPLFRHAANTYTLKRLVYQSLFPDLELRYVTHGFESVRAPYEEAKRRLRERHGASFALLNMPVTEFERQLTPASRA